ncbi:GT2 family glycosyltransferase [Azospirillum brasilense]|uniref:GT2 family glycosyltransferase n=1 Tax=Azospirillum brasilense TaxID=192 RepID=A0A560BC82_AZOBR|nr:glycosyltransferase [Azospirillum brasilense]TWA70265.1 GT2 family glycosyltransferase [Azospirillum brasilense]
MPTIVPIPGFATGAPSLSCHCPVCNGAGRHTVVAAIDDGGDPAGAVHRLLLCGLCGRPFLARCGADGVQGVPPEEAARWLDPPVDPRDYRAWTERFDRVGPADRDPVRRLASGLDLPGVALCLYDDDGPLGDDPGERADAVGQFQPFERGRAEPRDLLLFLHKEAVLRPHAVFLLADAARRQPDAVLFYGDEDRLGPDGERHAPFFKPAFSRDLFDAVDLFSACFAVRRSALADVADAQPRLLAARLAGTLPRGAVHRIPHILHHAVTDAAAARRTPDRTAIPRADIATDICDATLSVIIPTHAQEELLGRCVDSLYRLNPHTRIELIVVDNSRSPAYRQRLDAIVGGRPGAVILDWPEPFNFSRMMNAAAQRASGRLFCFLNDDTDGISPGWLRSMAVHARRPDIGAVGARLLYPDGSVQHAGVVLTGQAGAAHLHHHVPAGSSGHGGLAGLRQEVSAVTGACLMVEAEKFRAVGGFDDAELPVNFSDVDLCLKLRAKGFHTLYLPDATLHHHESVSRSARRGDSVRIAGQAELHRLVSRWQLGRRPDPYHNPNLSTVSLDGAFAWPPRVPYPWRRTVGVGGTDRHAEAALSVEARSRLRLEVAATAFREGRFDEAARAALAVLLDRGVAWRTTAAATSTFGLCMERVGGAELAAHFLRDAAVRDPVRVEHRHNLGNLLARLGRRAEAVAEFEGVLARNPYFVESVRSLATTLVADGDAERALGVLTRGCTTNPADAGLWLALAEVAWERAHYALCLVAAYWAGAGDEGVGTPETTPRALAYARAVFVATNAGHRVAAVDGVARAGGLPGWDAAGGPPAAQIAERRRSLLSEGDSSGSGLRPGDAQRRLADAVRRCDPRGGEVRFSVIMPVYRPFLPDLTAAIDSVRRQSHGNWELCIAVDGPQDGAVQDRLAEMAAADPRVRVVFRPERGHIAVASNSAVEVATGEYLALLDQDDELHPEALRLVADAVVRMERPHVLFTDEDRIDPQGRRWAAHAKKGWDPLLMLHQNAVSHLGVFRRDAVQRVGGFRPGSEGSQDHDLVLRLMRADLRPEPLRVIHLPHVLYHWRAGAESTAASIDAKPYALAAGREAVQEHLAAAFPGGEGARVVALRSLAGYRVLWPRSGPETSASLLLTAPVTRDAAAAAATLLAEAGAGAEGMTEVVAATAEGQALRVGLDGVLRMLDPLPPNASPAAVRRQLAAHCAGTHLLFCHPAVRLDEAGWVGALLRYASGTGCVAAGPKLVDVAGHVVSCGVTPDRRIIGRRHGFGAGGLAPGYFGRLAFSSRAGLLDELCVLIRRDALERSGGLDAQSYRHGLDLLDAMMRLRREGDLAAVPDALARLDAQARFNPFLIAHADPGDAFQFLQRWCFATSDD